MPVDKCFLFLRWTCAVPSLPGPVSHRPHTRKSRHVNTQRKRSEGVWSPVTQVFLTPLRVLCQKSTVIYHNYFSLQLGDRWMSVHYSRSSALVFPFYTVKLEKLWLISSWQEGWALLQFCRKWKLTGRRTYFPVFAARRAFLPLQTWSETSNWPFVSLWQAAAFAFLSQREKLLSSSSQSICRLWWVAVMDPLAKGLGKWGRPRRKESHPSQNASSLSVPSGSSQAPCPEPDTSQWWEPGTCPGSCG